MIRVWKSRSGNIFQIFHEAGMDRILEKQFLLTGYLEHLLLKNFSGDNGSARIEILTPSDHHHRGCQLSLVFNIDLGKVHKLLEENGVVVRSVDKYRNDLASVAIMASICHLSILSQNSSETLLWHISIW